jgi:hypothetical protein
VAIFWRTTITQPQNSGPEEGYGRRVLVPFPLKPRTIDAIAWIISGGRSGEEEKRLGKYRSGPDLEQFLGGMGVQFEVAGRSRVPALVEQLRLLNDHEDAWGTLEKIIEEAVDPRDVEDRPLEQRSEPVKYLNKMLAYDGFELQLQGLQMRLMEQTSTLPVVSHLSRKAEEFNFDTVTRDLNRALERVKIDPEAAVTSACSTLESVLRSILMEMEIGLPDQKDIQGLYKALKKPLGLSSDPKDRKEVPDELIAHDVTKILGGLSTLVEGVGALRTHTGDAHGRERGYPLIDRRIATLAVHSSSAMALFCIETWQKKYPGRVLRG